MPTHKQSLPTSADVVIIGGGIIGASVAYYLAKHGAQNTILLEKGVMGGGSTGKCVGGIRSQFSTQINLEFSKLSRAVFDHFEDEFGVDPDFRRAGYLFLATEEQHWEVLKANAELMALNGLSVELLDPVAIKRRWPFIRADDLLGGSYTANDGHAGPHEVLQGFIRAANKLGVLLREGVEVTGIQVKAGQVRGVTTSTGQQIHTQVVVNAAGPYAGRVASLAGLKVPVRPLRRQIFFTNAFEDLPLRLPLIIDLGQGWYIRREGVGLLLSGPQDAKSSFNEQVDFEAKEWTATRSIHRVPILEKAAIARGWAGLYEISPDHHAILGEFPEVGGFVCANGFSGHGFQHSPAVGMLVSEWVVEGRCRTLDIHPLRPQRFREVDLIHEPLTAFHD
jgi:sarcosine oxidase subunit beta